MENILSQIPPEVVANHVAICWSIADRCRFVSTFLKVTISFHT
jgi:hypothetical protein